MLTHLLPFTLINTSLETMLNERFDHRAYRLKPKHRFLSAHTTVNDLLPNRIMSGAVEVKGDVLGFTERGVIFEGDSKETEVDVAILATGYEVRFPFLSTDILDVKDNNTSLYRHVVIPDLKRPETLSFIGLLQPAGSLIPISELQARWVCQHLLGNVKLPSREKMECDIERRKKRVSERYYDSPRHTMQVDPIPFMDELAGDFGASPNFLKYFFTDISLLCHLFFGPHLPYQYRLNGPGSWDGARDAIIHVQDRILHPFKTTDHLQEEISCHPLHFIEKAFADVWTAFPLLIRPSILFIICLLVMLMLYFM